MISSVVGTRVGAPVGGQVEGGRVVGTSESVGASVMLGARVGLNTGAAVRFTT